MKRIPLVIVTVVLGLACTAAAWSQTQSLTLAAGGLKESGPPKVVGRYVLFSYQYAKPAGEGQIHTVLAAFEHENYSRLYPFGRNENGVYVLTIPLPEGVDVIRYRLVVDGIWTADPNAPSQFADRWGVRISEVSLNGASRSVREYPWVSGDGDVEFRVQAKTGQSVSLVGSFNGWDPFMTPMAETQPGVYSRVLRLPKGEHLYYFMIDGLRVPDPGNAERKWNVNGMAVSVVDLP